MSLFSGFTEKLSRSKNVENFLAQEETPSVAVATEVTVAAENTSVTDIIEEIDEEEFQLALLYLRDRPSDMALREKEQALQQVETIPSLPAGQGYDWLYGADSMPL